MSSMPLLWLAQLAPRKDQVQCSPSGLLGSLSKEMHTVQIIRLSPCLGRVINLQLVRPHLRLREQLRKIQHCDDPECSRKWEEGCLTEKAIMISWSESYELMSPKHQMKCLIAT